MKIARLAYGLGVLVWLGACAQRAPEASAPSASSTSKYASPPAAEAAPVTAPASPPPAPAPQGLADESGKRKSAELDEEFATLEAAERALNQAKSDLDRLALAEPSPSVGRSVPSDGAAEKKDRSAAQAPKAGAAASSAPNALCENACRAFSSMSRAASAVCRLDGSSGAHCTHAKRVLAGSQLRVASCSCPTE
jgi:pyruvate/2-oxoglutarate dehydrogenase complex dihydrolipoamide acyltransferase (E2) component